jgi:hypothetical protein
MCFKPTGMVAECLGVLTSMLSAQIIPLLQQLAAEEDKLGRYVIYIYNIHI